MKGVESCQPANLILDSLSSKQRSRLCSVGEVAVFVAGDLVYEMGAEIEYAYFPYTGFVSRTACVSDSIPMEVTLIGNEGMLGASLITGVSTAPLTAIVHGPGAALQIDCATFQKEMSIDSQLRLAVGRYLHLLIGEITRKATCAHFHEVGPRLARCLLAVQNRMPNGQFYLTHQNLADMLGVQRSAVSIAAGVLQQSGSIRYSRGLITVVDRKLLEAAACGCDTY